MAFYGGGKGVETCPDIGEHAAVSGGEEAVGFVEDDCFCPSEPDDGVVS